MDSLNGKIRVYNYQQSPIGFPSSTLQNGVFIEARDEDEEFKMERVLWEDIELENNKSDVFKTGRLRFNPDEEDEIYNKLGIDDKENIKTDKELMKILLDDSIENLKRINKIKSLTLLTRMKKILFKMERVNKIPPHNIISVVSERCDDLKNGGKKKNENSVVNQLIEKERKQNEEGKLKETIDNLVKEVQIIKDEKSKTEEASTKALTDLLEMVNQLKEENKVLKESVDNKIGKQNESKSKTK